jgi:hypothetical protein
MDISLQGGGSTPSLVGARKADSPVIRTTSIDSFPSVPLPSQDYQTAIERAEAQRFDGVYKASAAAAKDFTRWVIKALPSTKTARVIILPAM